MIKDNLANYWRTILFGFFVISVGIAITYFDKFKPMIIFETMFLGVLLILGSIFKPEKPRKTKDVVLENTNAKLDPSDHDAFLQFYLNNQKNIRYHGERMWDSMKIFGVIFPAITGILTILIDYLTTNGDAHFGKEISALFLIPIFFTGIFWFNSYREYFRFMEYSSMSWRAEKKLNFHKPLPELDNKPLVIERFLKKPHWSILHVGKTFWTTICLFFGTSLVVQAFLMFYIYSLF